MRKKLKILGIIVLLLGLFLGFLFQKQIITHLKIALFITEIFPQIPVKPLGLLTQIPFRDRMELETKNGKVVGDLFTPIVPGPKSALILAMGVKTSEKDKPILLHFAQTMARLGYITFWPRLEVLDKGESLPEEPETFIESFKYLESLPQTDPERITFVGFSVGSSTAFVAISDPQISDKVYSLVFFGGYFDIFDYLLSLASKSINVNGAKVSWTADEDATNHAKSLLEAKKARQVLKIFEATSSAGAEQILKDAPEDEVNGLKRFSPKEKKDQFKAEIFILHEKSDALVPYVESVKLNQALPENINKTFLLVNLFEHVQPKRPINIGELVKLYGFLYKVFASI